MNFKKNYCVCDDYRSKTITWIVENKTEYDFEYYGINN